VVGLTVTTYSEVSAHSGPARYRVKLSLDARPSSGETFVCELVRAEAGGGSAQNAQLKLSVPVRRGARMPLGHLIRTDGSRLDVFATVR